MSSSSPAPRQRGNNPRHRKNASLVSTPTKNSHQHVQVHHQLAHTIQTPHMQPPPVARGITTPPHTPRSTAPAQKKRTRKLRPKDVNTQTPIATHERNEQLPTPVSGGKFKENVAYDKPLATPTGYVAYAGPTFHSSPAASTLPVPSIFSKSVPTGIQDATLSNRLFMEETSSGSDASPPASDISTPSSSPPTSHVALNIDGLFRAAKEEKEKARRSSPLARHASSPSSEEQVLVDYLARLQVQEPESPSARLGKFAERHDTPFESALFGMDSDSDRASPVPQRPTHHRSQTAAATNPQFDYNWARQTSSPFVNVSTSARAHVNRAPPRQLDSPMSPAFPKYLHERPSPQPSPNRLLWDTSDSHSRSTHWESIERPSYTQHTQTQSFQSAPKNDFKAGEDMLRNILGIGMGASTMRAQAAVA